MKAHIWTLADPLMKLLRDWALTLGFSIEVEYDGDCTFYILRKTLKEHICHAQADGSDYCRDCCEFETQLNFKMVGETGCSAYIEALDRFRWDNHFASLWQAHANMVDEYMEENVACNANCPICKKA